VFTARYGLGLYIQFYVLPTQCVYVWIWEQTAIISLYNINWLVCITETESVFCAVRTGSLYTIPRSAHAVYLCILCGSENKQRLFPYTTLPSWFLGTFAKLRKATLSFAISVCLHGTALFPLKDFQEIWYLWICQHCRENSSFFEIWQE